MKIRLERRDWLKIGLISTIGTLVCIGVALALDYGNFSRMAPEFKAVAIRNNILIPIVLALPAFTVFQWKIRQLAIAKMRLEELAYTDSLTGCLNRRAFIAKMAEWERQGRQGVPDGAALMVIDVDYFKRVNDALGHEQGDHVLIGVAAAINSAIRPIDVLGRMGGEEFAVFMPGVNKPVASLAAERLRLAVMASGLTQAGDGEPLTISVGVAWSGGRVTFIELYPEADKCLYLAKQTGRNCVVLKEFRAEQHAA
ncbi:GGDEF domain-containing protein [Rhizobium sp. TRM95111]|uniref:GGDEF domain-containing protein n=1 Tax=Rhizobium alarense TaxID=2846851 RepID=UPI001F2FC7D7|nr:GGDEF domain-containing protein [Rhizobium alarense]MCF3638541.1 GGDEF domain-containing protein [Rhizobium alarense]